MVWTTPITAVVDEVFLSSDFNESIRDNLLETAPAKAETPGSWFMTAISNFIAERDIESDNVPANESTTSTAFTDLATVGPRVSLATGETAVVFFSATAQEISGADNRQFYTSVEVSGATSISASNAWGWSWDGLPSGQFLTGARWYRFTGLNSGVHTFTMKYQTVSSSTEAEFQNRFMFALPA